MSPAGTAADRFHGVEAEREEHGFLQPLVDAPLAVDLLGNARGASVEHADCPADEAANLHIGVRGERVPLLPQLLDQRFELVHAVSWRMLASQSLISVVRTSTTAAS